MTESTEKNLHRRWLENGLMLTGLGLLAVFALFKGWSAMQSNSGITEFEKARAEFSSQPVELVGSSADDEAVSPVMPGDSPQFQGSEPDYSLWSEKRIAEYQASLQAADDAPQALLTIDHLDIRVPVFNGATDLNLNRGVARIIGTGQIGLVGNIGIAGHRDGFFRPLQDIQLGDELTFETLWGTTQYQVTSITIVGSDDISVLAPSDAAAITLVTCYPFYYVGNAPKRFIVRAEVSSEIADS